MWFKASPRELRDEISWSRELAEAARLAGTLDVSYVRDRESGEYRSENLLALRELAKAATNISAELPRAGKPAATRKGASRAKRKGPIGTCASGASERTGQPLRTRRAPALEGTAHMQCAMHVVLGRPPVPSQARGGYLSSSPLCGC